MGYIYAFFRWLTLRPSTVHCWYSPRDDDWLATPATCLLRFRHWGQHRFTLDSDIKLKFKP